MEKKFEHNSFDKRLKSMLSVDARRMFTTSRFYIMVGICFVIPILILVMTTMMDGSVSVNPQTGAGTVMVGIENTWQIVSSFSGQDVMAMDMTAMVNMNLVYFLLTVLVCLFVADDFRSGYAKNLFTVRAKKTDYVISKTIVCFIGGVCMILAFFAGTMIGGAIAGLSFDTGDAGTYGVVMCLLSKVFLVAVFVPMYLVVSVAAKQKAWLSVLGSFGIGMLLCMMIPILTPLDATIMNAFMCLAGGVLFSVGLGVASNSVLSKTSLV
jgi:ABC-type transport system involved in multi-copper enzyme maturation permease subunit